VYATTRKKRSARIGCADIPIIAVRGRPGFADTVQTHITHGAVVVITARQRVVRKDATCRRIAGVSGADIVVVAGPGGADANLIGTHVHGTGIAISTGGAIRLSYARITTIRHRGLYTIARGRITGIGGARIAVVAVLLCSRADRVFTHIA